MKIVCKTNKRLAKSKEGLVKVGVIVNGKTKQYASHRWKSALAALNLLKDNIKVKHNQEIEFKSKDTGKKLSESEFLDSFKKEKTGETIQQYAKKNYTIVKKKEAKDKKITNLYNEKSENQEKTDTIDNLPELKGSEKQIKWAEDIRNDYIQTYEDYKNFQPNKETFDKHFPLMEEVEKFNVLSEKICKGHREFGFSTVFSWLKHSKKTNIPEVIEVCFEEARKINDASLEVIYRETLKNNQSYQWIGGTMVGYADDYTYKKVKKMTDEAKITVAKKEKEIIQKYKKQLKEKEKENEKLGLMNLNYEEISIHRTVECTDFRNSLYKQLQKDIEATKNSKLDKDTRGKLEERNNILSKIFEENTDYKDWGKMERAGVENLNHLLNYSKGTYITAKNEYPDVPEYKDEEDTQIGTIVDEESDIVIGRNPHGANIHAGTKKIKSTGEFKPQKNVDAWTKSVSVLKDKDNSYIARSIMDAGGNHTPLFFKENGGFDLSGGLSVGYCQRIEGVNKEIGIANRDNKYDLYKTCYHEMLHSKFTHLVDADHSGNDIFAGRIEEPIVELGGQALARKTFDNAEGNKHLYSYNINIVNFVPKILKHPELKEARKRGLIGIGEALANRLYNGDKEFVDSLIKTYHDSDTDYAYDFYEGIVKDAPELIDKAYEKCNSDYGDTLNDNAKSDLADFVEMVKRGEISIEVALNSPKYRDIAAVLLNKMTEDEDLDALLEMLGL